jgi:hypothetical protein
VTGALFFFSLHTPSLPSIHRRPPHQTLLTSRRRSPVSLPYSSLHAVILHHRLLLPLSAQAFSTFHFTERDSRRPPISHHLCSLHDVRSIVYSYISQHKNISTSFKNSTNIALRIYLIQHVLGWFST